MTSFLKRMPAGIPGDVTRAHAATIEPQVQSGTGYLTAYGLPVAISSIDSGVRGIGSSDNKDTVYGFLVRSFPTTGNGTDGLGTSTPPVSGPVSVMTRGYMSALLGGSAAAVKGAPIFIRIANPSTGKVVGDVEAAADIGVTAAATVGTGTQTAGTLSATSNTPAGIYTVKMTSGSAFDVLDASGQELLHSGAFATQYTLDNGLSFKMTTGGTPTTGDTTAITVAVNTIQLGSRSYFMGAADASGNVEIAFNI